jgi:hypothetical protein
MSIQTIFLSYEDIIEAQQKRGIKEAEATAARSRRSSNCRKALSQVLGQNQKAMKEKKYTKSLKYFRNRSDSQFLSY